MALIKYTRPGRDLFSRSFNDLVNEFFDVNSNSYRTDRFMPSIDVAETDTRFEIAVELPGLKKDEINVDFEDGRLTISGERSFKDEEKKKNYHRIETSYGAFTRSVYLPDGVNEDSIEAKYADGILNITIDKNADKEKKQIEIS